MKTAKSDEDLDRIFEEGEESILDYADMSSLRHPNRERNALKALSVQLPEWLVGVLDGEAARMGISRQAVMKVWLTERADSLVKA
ncbi:CopG family transcriptional regulator [Bifidobacterium pullorum subsp. gallinarum]|uniref:CopG family transcriptional regulator n=1 Tax=Bifidobacterium pullorum subsp. gallinarum TaxID=78344 RepID=A0A4P6DVB9_9BIFI|nr:CopG family transcriptional regulator [Bifidobacterium pullorum]QAY32544.1 CopG family transcriptional regulator [Bifidobacterium pullorum subsp. gallinarum]